MKIGAPLPKATPRRPVTGSWRVPARESGPVRTATDVRLRRSSTLPRRLLVGRLLRGASLLALAGLAAVGVVQVASWVERSGALPVRTVAVRGVEGARADEVLAYAGVKAGQPLFGVDVDAVARRVLEHPFIASATVRRVPPDGIEIRVTTRAPRAALSVGGGVYLVDERGQVMKAARAGDGLDLPVLTGFSAADVTAGTATKELAAAVALLSADDAAGSPGGRAGEVHLVSGVGFELVLADGTRVAIGEDTAGGGFSAKLARLAVVEHRLRAAGRSASFIDLDDDRRPERAAVRLRPLAEMPPAGSNTGIPRERG